MNYPRHIAIIPDGNRTWASEQGLPKIEGHIRGFDGAVNLAKYIFSQTPIEVFTLWGLSTENLHNRPQEELEYLFQIYKSITGELEDFLVEHTINLKRTGSRVGLPEHLLSYMDEQAKKLTFPDSEKTMVLAINYGGRDELLRGIHAWNESPDREELTEEILSKYMDFGDLPTVELVIRTKGDEASRLSGFMLWWIGYAELYFTSLKFPAFDTVALDQALAWFDGQCEKRNFGK